MSAIAGVLSRRRQIRPFEALSAPMAALVAYGPDGSDVWHEAEIALGHQLQRETPEAQHERQPLHQAASGLVITADARLDNRQELFDRLNIPAAQRSQIPDNELILAAYQRWGTDCPRHLLGDFAIAIWDGRRRRLFCARDPLGIRPFYYSADEQAFVFASDIRAVMEADCVRSELDESFLASLLREDHFQHAERTAYRGISKLAPAHTLCVEEQGELSLSEYWRPEDAPSVRLGGLDQYAACLIDLLERSVEARLRSVEPVAAHASGGLDSTSVAALAARQLQDSGQSLDVFSWGPPWEQEGHTDRDERPRLERQAQRSGFNVHYAPVTIEDYWRIWMRDITCEPKQNIVRESVVARQARERGVGVILSGWGGDELVSFNGRGYFAEQFVRFRWWKMFQEMHCRQRVQGERVMSTLRHRVAAPLLPDFFHHARRRSRHAMPSCLRPGFARWMQQAGRIERPRLRERADIRRNQQALLRHGHLTARAEHWAAAGAEHGLIYRYPLLDRRLVEFALGLPSEMSFRQGWKRFLLRYAMRGILTDELRWHKDKFDGSLVRSKYRYSPQLRGRLAAWLTEKRHDPGWGVCLDFDTAGKLLASERDEDMVAVFRTMEVEIAIHRHQERMLVRQPLQTAGRPRAA